MRSTVGPRYAYQSAAPLPHASLKAPPPPTSRTKEPFSVPTRAPATHARAKSPTSPVSIVSRPHSERREYVAVAVCDVDSPALERVTLRMSAADSVLSVKLLLAELWGHPPSRQTLGIRRSDGRVAGVVGDSIRVTQLGGNPGGSVTLFLTTTARSQSPSSISRYGSQQGPRRQSVSVPPYADAGALDVLAQRGGERDIAAAAASAHRTSVDSARKSLSLRQEVEMLDLDHKHAAERRALDRQLQYEAACVREYARAAEDRDEASERLAESSELRRLRAADAVCKQALDACERAAADRMRMVQLGGGAAAAVLLPSAVSRRAAPHRLLPKSPSSPRSRRPVKQPDSPRSQSVRFSPDVASASPLHAVLPHRSPIRGSPKSSMPSPRSPRSPIRGSPKRYVPAGSRLVGGSQRLMSSAVRRPSRATVKSPSFDPARRGASERAMRGSAASESWRGPRPPR
eukprot:TRINITY_DN9394_c1_g1_i1.p1 TRINITY_DN9394_c1_g1~~TRINITY_DN9394_c1_g1_i1.p1  ORF type:complete len:459 (+),score=40.09 TRINITY_DN9394_c1_g1_i1:94-1470(+)